MRKAGNTVKPSIIIEKNGKKWSVNIRSTFKNHDFTAEEGVEVFESNLIFKYCLKKKILIFYIY
jgi:hypothetical protein